MSVSSLRTSGTTSVLNAADAFMYDYLIVGGGTAGCVIASRLAEYLPHKKILLIEGGPSDYMDDRVLDLKKWLDLLGGDLDYDYGTTEQPNGNSFIRHSRAKVLGGCSSHNTLISFRPFEYDCKTWVSRGCDGWDFNTFMRVLDNLRNTVRPVHPKDRNQLCKDWVKACSTAMNIPIVEDFNKLIKTSGCIEEAVGFLSVSYNPENGYRSSASVAYIHPILSGEESRPNLTILTNAWAERLNVQDDRVTGVDITLQNGNRMTLHAKSETIVCAGAIDTPRLFLLSGIGPQEQLESLRIPVKKDIRGVGENLLDHPESIILWELNQPVPNETVMDSDAAIFLRRQVRNAADNDESAADIMCHCYQIPFDYNTARLGYDTPTNAFCMTPNVPRPRSRGRLYLTSADPKVKPALDFRYFTDPEGYDAATIVAGLKAARRIAQEEPFKSWIKREVAPGPSIQSDEDLSYYGRKVHHTVYHPAGTMKMGDLARDGFAVLDSKLKVRGLKGVRVADASVFPTLPSLNPMIPTLAVGERAAELIAEEAGWRREERPRL